MEALGQGSNNCMEIFNSLFYCYFGDCSYCDFVTLLDLGHPGLFFFFFFLFHVFIFLSVLSISSFLLVLVDYNTLNFKGFPFGLLLLVCLPFYMPILYPPYL